MRNRATNRIKTARGKRVAVFIFLTVLGVSAADAVDANDRFKGGSYDGYGKLESETLQLPKMATMIMFF
jgi:hypothetical protein